MTKQDEVKTETVEEKVEEEKPLPRRFACPGCREIRYLAWAEGSCWCGTP
jgi:hypothetical protein